MPLTIEQILQESADKVAADELARKQADGEMNITKADLGSLFTEFKTQLLGEINPQIEAVKAEIVIPNRGAGTGRKGTEPSTDPTRDEDPAAYLVKKAATKPSDGSEDVWDLEDKALIGNLFFAALTHGLRD